MLYTNTHEVNVYRRFVVYTNTNEVNERELPEDPGSELSPQWHSRSALFLDCSLLLAWTVPKLHMNSACKHQLFLLSLDCFQTHPLFGIQQLLDVARCDPAAQIHP